MPVHVVFVVDKVALRQVYLNVVRFSRSELQAGT